MVDVVGLNLIQYLDSVAQRLGNISEHLIHLLLRLEPLLLSVEHTCGVVQVLARRHTEQMVVCLGIVLVHEMAVIGAYQLYAIFLRKLYHHLVRLHLQRIRLPVCPQIRVVHTVALQLDVVVLAEHPVIPFYRLACSGNVIVEDFVRHLATETRRADNQSLVILLQILAVGTWSHIETVYPRVAHELHEVVITRLILRQHNQVITTLVALFLMSGPASVSRDIHLTAQYRLEWFLAFLFQFLVHLIAVVKEDLRAEHIAVVGYRHTLHSVAHSLVYELFNGRLSVENRVVCMYV